MPTPSRQKKISISTIDIVMVRVWRGGLQRVCNDDGRMRVHYYIILFRTFYDGGLLVRARKTDFVTGSFRIEASCTVTLDGKYFSDVNVVCEQSTAQHMDIHGHSQ